jgi:hypothetical protein
MVPGNIDTNNLLQDTAAMLDHHDAQVHDEPPHVITVPSTSPERCRELAGDSPEDRRTLTQAMSTRT